MSAVGQALSTHNLLQSLDYVSICSKQEKIGKTNACWVFFDSLFKHVTVTLVKPVSSSSFQFLKSENIFFFSIYKY